ncbi:MAG: hypothetical protein LH628_12175 [Microcoleus sp. CAN_BIN18]|nr:hypothetical protein [Microcoleus sp. CAN_BIN18]
MIDTFERFVENEKWKLEQCLRGSGRLTERLPDISAVCDSDSLKEQYYWFMLGIACHAWDFDDGIDWKALEKKLLAYSSEVFKEWMMKKKVQDACDKNY